MATKKSGGSTSNYSKPNPKYHGVKKFGGEKVKSGNIIVTQVGNKYWAGDYAGTGRNFTIFAKADGIVKMHKGFKDRTYISIIPDDSNV